MPSVASELTELIKQTRTTVDLAQDKVAQRYVQHDDSEPAVDIDFGKVRGILSKLAAAVNAMEQQKEV